MCIYCDYCVYHYKSTELVSLYTLDIGLKINIIIIIIEDCDSLQSDLNYVYDWAKTNNIVFNFQIFKYLSFSTNVSITCDYVSPNFYVIDNVNNLKDLGIIMSSNCSFEQHIIELRNGVLACAAGFSDHLAQESQPI